VTVGAERDKVKRLIVTRILIEVVDLWSISTADCTTMVEFSQYLIADCLWYCHSLFNHWQLPL
jgi:hypothetical protein